MKLPQLLSRKKLRATTARRALGGTDMDYEEMSEPNMKLSRALLIVLVLHVVAVAGIVAFNTIKARQGPPSPVSSENAAAKVAPEVSVNAEGPLVASARTDESKVIKAPPKLIATEDHKIERAKPVENSPAKPVAGKTYVVAKGDSPVSIARKFKIPFDDLMTANRIDDPTKLKIGQKLIIPKTTTKPKKAAK